MRNLTLHAAILAVALPLAGCEIWFGGGDDCVDWAAPGADAESVGYRNPENGQCESWGGGGGGGGCGDYAAEPLAFPDWGLCYSECSGLDETSCLAAPGCRAAYLGDCPEGFDCLTTSYYFAECWAVAPSGPVQGGDCSTLDAYECSRHDDCVARHYPDWYSGCGGSTPCPALIAPTFGNFESCANEEGEPPPGCYGDEECGAGSHCNAAEVCLPPPGCGPTPMPGGGESDIACPAVCYGWCVPDQMDESCYGDVLCDSIEPSCPAGSTPGIANGCWTGNCIPYGACSPAIDPGSCYGEALCELVSPVCPEGSTPGIKDGCYTGLCIPLESCEPPPPCEVVFSEAACIERFDCVPTYQGVDCSCDPNGCGCADWVFLSCQADLWME